MRTNRTTAGRGKQYRTHEGGQAAPQRPLVELERAVSVAFLNEDTFYAPGETHTERIAALCAKVEPEQLAALAVQAREEHLLRHMPLFLAVQLTKHGRGKLVGDTIATVIRRPDELSEFLALYFREGKHPLSKQTKRGLGLAFQKFSAYQLAKWNQDRDIMVRDVLFLIHAKPKAVQGIESVVMPAPALNRKTYRRGQTNRHMEGQGKDWSDLVAGTLAAPDTWEVALSAAGKSQAKKLESWTRLLKENVLGYNALLQNLRNMDQAGVDPKLVDDAIVAGAVGSKVLPVRFISALAAAPMHLDALNVAMTRAVASLPKLPGATVLVLDVSGSMDQPLSEKSERRRIDAMAAFAVLVREVAESVRVFTFSERLVEIAGHRGLALPAAIWQSQPHGGTYLGAALHELVKIVPETARVIVVTDEQSHDGFRAAWTPRSYLINIAPEEPGLDTHQGWVRVSGWSQSLVRWILRHEQLDDAAVTDALPA